MSAEHPSYMSRRGLFRHVGAGTAAIALGGLLLPLRAATAEEHTAHDSGTAAVKKGNPWWEIQPRFPGIFTARTVYTTTSS